MDNRTNATLPKIVPKINPTTQSSKLSIITTFNSCILFAPFTRIKANSAFLSFKVLNKAMKIEIPEIPEIIPCNVCSKKVALENVLRKHSDSGSWQPLERDIFLYKFMGQEKSAFLVLEEDTAIISTNPHLNKRFVKEEIFRDDMLKALGFSIRYGKLNSLHSDEEAISVLTDISEKVKANKISTRENRGKVIEVLDPQSQQIIDQNKNKRIHRSKISFGPAIEPKKAIQTRRTAKKHSELFGGKLYLTIGDVSNLYRDIDDLYSFYCGKKDELSQTFPGLVRMALRLLCETAAKSKNKKLDDYLKEHFSEAKKTLDQDIKTTLSNHNVKEESIVQLLHTGAHNYQSSNNIDQTIAISLIIGAILTFTHGKAE